MVGRMVQARVGAMWLGSEHNLDELRRVLHEIRFWDLDQIAVE